MVQHALDRGYEVVGVCRQQSVGKLDRFKERITLVPGATDDREVIEHAVSGCDGVLVVLVPWGVHGYSTGTAEAVLDCAPPGARLVFSCGWHITLDGRDVYSRKLRAQVKISVRYASSLRRPRRPGGGVPAGVRQRHSVDCRARQRPRGGREPGPARVEPACGRPDPREQHHAPHRLCPIHGGGAREHELIHQAPAIVGARRPRRSRIPPANELRRGDQPKANSGGRTITTAAAHRAKTGR